jgi:hypothetical protein
LRLPYFEEVALKPVPFDIIVIVVPAVLKVTLPLP